ncbi:amidotransferase [Pseudomonas sp. WN033]|nr:amidotransferase [Pseudomonas sp. WN033]
MRAHYLQHAPFEGLGRLEPALLARGYQISVTRLFANESLPALADIDLLIVMGGPMSVNDEAQFPWLAAEKAFIAGAIAAGLPVLGVCLGAQLIACSQGARVYPNHLREIGWFPVQAVGAGAENWQFPAQVLVLHWHGETFDLPPGAVHLARSPGCEHQAFQLGRNVIGLQFHPEATPELLREFVEQAEDDLTADRYVQPAERILAVSTEQLAQTGALLENLLDYLLA